MSQQKHKASHPRIKQFFTLSLNKNFLLLHSQEVQTPAAMNAIVFSILLCRKYNIQLLESQFQLTVSH